MKMLAKLQKRLQEGKKDNKGFSLVELIIVIAIMAILIGIVGMNIIPQIENARQSKDLQVLSAYLTESVQALTQNASKCSATEYTLTITPSNGNVSVTCASDSTGAKAIEDSFKALSGIGTKIDFESNAGKNIGTITIALSLKSDAAQTAKLTLTASDTSGADVTQLVDSNGLTSK